MLVLTKMILFCFIGFASGQAQTRSPCDWLSRSNTNTKNGIPTSYLTLPDCQKNCLAYNSCLHGIDWDPNNINKVMCWFSTTGEAGSATGVFHYYQSCASMTTIIGLSTTPPTSTPSTPGACQWTVLNNTNTKDGTRVPKVNTTEGCMTACQLNIDCIKRLGFDFNTIDNTCYISTQSGFYNTSGVRHYTPSPSCQYFFSNSSKIGPGFELLFFLLILAKLIQ